jgi:serine/threonine protein kinase
MAWVHQNGVIHLDLRPNNIFLNYEWEPVIGRFSSSRATETGLTGTLKAGAPIFMAHELWNERRDVAGASEC